jgi:DNA helicase-2/ATP-dependent DNA helicase PcrA
VSACYESFTDARTVDDLSRAIENLFSDQDSAIVLSTVHRAKGLEADRVFILCPEKLPLVWKGQRPEQFQQELHLRYVGLTRSKDTLIFVESER